MHGRIAVPLILVFSLGVILVPVFAVDFSPIPYLKGKSWAADETYTWEVEGRGIDNGKYKLTTRVKTTYTITSVSTFSFTLFEEFSVEQTETATGSWVKPAQYVTCSGCTATTKWTGSGGLTIDKNSYTYTQVSGDFASDNIGHKTSDIVDVTRLSQDNQIQLWWYDENADYLIVPYRLFREDTFSIGGQRTKVLVASYTGTSAGCCRVGTSRSKGETTRTFEFDKSTGVMLAAHVEGSYSYQRSGGGWEETLSSDSKVTSVQFDLGDYVLIDSEPRAVVTVDGADLPVASQPKLFVWSWDSSHSVAAPSVVDVSNDTRLVFNGWKDGKKNQTRTILADKVGTYVAEFKTQYMLSLASPYGSPTGSGWHDEGESVDVHVEPTYFFVLVFTGWSGDVQSNSPDITVNMDAPKILRANWEISYLRLAVVIGIAALIPAGVIIYRKRQRPSIRRDFDQEEGSVLVGPFPSTKFCILCGTEILAIDRFCRKCGASQQ